MIKSVILLAALGCVSAAFLYTNDRCHEGPAYWCSSEEISESCQATKFCEQNIWVSSNQFNHEEKEQAKDVGGYITCKACTWVLGMVEGYIFTDANEVKVIDFTTKICDLIPTNMTDTCKSFIQQYGKQVLNTLSENLEPTMVCTALRQCDKTSASALLLGLSKSTTCSTCKTTMKEMREQHEDLFSWWQNSCGDVEDTVMCVKYSEYAQLLNKAILNDNICEEMEMC